MTTFQKVPVLIATLIALSCGSGANDRPLRALTESCKADDECESSNCGLVEQSYGTASRQCSVPCDVVGADCKGEAEGDICQASKSCGPRCPAGNLLDDGRLCVEGLGRDCVDVDPALACGACGCDVFGGGVCVSGTGCVVPAPNGNACSVSEGCLSGACDPAEGVCIEPRALRDACQYDIQCQSRNCSNDGDSAKSGVCHQKLGTDCDANDEAPTCNDCRSAGPGILGTCTRLVCNPQTAAECGKGYRCGATAAGGFFCYQQ